MQSGGAWFTPVISSLSLRPPFFMSGFWNKWRHDFREPGISLIMTTCSRFKTTHRSVLIPTRSHDKVCSTEPLGRGVFHRLLARFSLENWNSFSSQMLFSSSPMKSNAARFIPLFISPFSRQPSLSRHCFQSSSSSLCSVPEVFISAHGWHGGEPHKRASDLRRRIPTIRETAFHPARMQITHWSMHGIQCTPATHTHTHTHTVSKLCTTKPTN